MGYSGAKIADAIAVEPAAEAARRMAEDLGEFMTLAVKMATPVDTGHLRESWHRSPTIIITDEVGNIVFKSGTQTDVEYAPYLEWGTGIWGPKHMPYPIRPKKPGGWLHWVSPEGHDVFAKLVMHPGIHPVGMIAFALGVTERAMHTVCEPALLSWLAKTEAVWDAEATRAAAEVRRIGR